MHCPLPLLKVPLLPLMSVCFHLDITTVHFRVNHVHDAQFLDCLVALHVVDTGPGAFLLTSSSLNL